MYHSDLCCGLCMRPPPVLSLPLSPTHCPPPLACAPPTPRNPVASLARKFDAIALLASKKQATFNHLFIIDEMMHSKGLHNPIQSKIFKAATVREGQADIAVTWREECLQTGQQECRLIFE